MFLDGKNRVHEWFVHTAEEGYIDIAILCN